jgi:uncharacterized phosphosugar-binding protein
MSEARTSIVDEYLRALQGLIEKFRETQRVALDRAAELVVQALAGGGVLHLFGTGHSHMLAEEIFYRAGGLIPINAMLAPEVVLSGGALRSTETERTPGKAAEIAARYDLRAGDAGVVVSNSGRNPMPVEMARLMKGKGLSVIALTNMVHSRAVKALDPPGARLFEVADVVLDNGGAHGDAFLQLKGVPYPVGPTSTVIGAAIMQSLVLSTLERLSQRGADVLNLPSANVDGAESHVVLEGFARLRARIGHL